MNNHLYEFTIKVLRGAGCDLPDNMLGAYVACYASGTDYQSAMQNGVATITNMHFVFDSILGDVRQIPIDSWNDYVTKVWPELTAHFPSQNNISSFVDSGSVFFGPFAGFKDVN